MTTKLTPVVAASAAAVVAIVLANLLVTAATSSTASAAACGALNQRACKVTERIPSCNARLVEWKGNCVSKGACGALGQRACTVGERIPSCGKGLLEGGDGICNKPVTCSNSWGQQPCRYIPPAPKDPCQTYVVGVDSRCNCKAHPGAPRCDPCRVPVAGARCDCRAHPGASMCRPATRPRPR